MGNFRILTDFSLNNRSRIFENFGNSSFEYLQKFFIKSWSGVYVHEFEKEKEQVPNKF